MLQFADPSEFAVTLVHDLHYNRIFPSGLSVLVWTTDFMELATTFTLTVQLCDKIKKDTRRNNSK